MIQASYRNFNAHSNNRGSYSSRHSRRSSPSNSNLKNSSSSSNDFTYKETNKHQWAKLQSKVKQRLMSENISYIEDDEEVARRSIPPPPAAFLAPPAFLETAQDKEERQRQQKILDETRKKKEDKFEEYRDNFAKDFPKGISAHYAFLSQSIITDLERTIENIIPPTTNVMIQYRVMKDRLLNKFGPNSQKDAEETRRKIESLHGDHRGWDIYLAALDSLVEVLTKTPVRDTSNNPIMQPVPIRPHLLVPPVTATLAQFVAYANDDANDRQAWELLHPADKIMNHRPTDAAIKSWVLLALDTSIYTPYSNLAQRYRQNDHATKTWADLRMDIDSIITNKSVGTSRDPEIHIRQRDRNPREWRRSPSHFDPSAPPAESRSSQIPYEPYHHDHRKRSSEQSHSGIPQDVRSATPTRQASTPTQAYPCANCAGDHRATDCDSLKCFTCQATFPTAAMRQAHYMSTHRRDSSSKRTRFAPIQNPTRGPHTPPSSPFLSRSVTEMQNPSPYDSGYDSSFSTASGPGQPPSSRGNSDIEDQVDRYIRDQRVATIVTDPPETTHNIPLHPPRMPWNPDHIDISRFIAQAHRTLAHTNGTSPSLTVDSENRGDNDDDIYVDEPTACVTPTNPTAPLYTWHDMSHEDPRDPSRHTPYGYTISDPYNIVRPPRNQTSLPDPSDSDGDDSTSTSDSPPPLIAASSDDEDTSAHDPELSDDARNAINRRCAPLQNRNQPPYPYPQRLIAAGHRIFDIRATTHDSDSTPAYPGNSDSSDADTPHYWPEPTNPTPPPSNSPPPVMITDRQLLEWIESQLPWNIFRERIPTLRDTPIELCGPPTLYRDLPNRIHMYEHTYPHADNLDAYKRISDFLRSASSWSTYLKTLPPLIRRFYLNMPPTHSDYLSYTRTATTSRLGGYPEQYARNSLHPHSLKRDRTPNSSDSDSGTRSFRHQSRDHPASVPQQPPTRNTKPAQTRRIAEETAYERPSDGPRPRFPGEDKSTPDLTPHECDDAARRRADSIQNWYRVHTNPIAPHPSNSLPIATSSSSSSQLPSHNSDTKDPAVPHPDDVDDYPLDQPPPNTPPMPAEQRALTAVTRLGGYHSAPQAPAPRPTLTSILKSHKADQISKINRLPASRESNQQGPNSANTSNHQTTLHSAPAPSRHQFQPIIPNRPRTVTRPYIPAPRIHDVDGTPWCHACTAQLSDDDLNTPGLRDPDLPDIRYRLRMDNDQPPTHSNTHSDLTRIHRTNAEYHRQQRESTESHQARTGILPSLQTHTSYVNTPDASDIEATIARFQYQRYRSRGGRLNRGTHHRDFSYNSPNTTNMTPGDPYRRWFHRTISRSYYSLGEATNQYEQWLNDPDYGPSPTPHLSPQDSPPYLPRARTSSPPTPTRDYSTDHSQQPPTGHRDARAQTIVQDVHTSPDDPNAVLDSGAMMTTAPRRLLMTTPEWESNIRPAPPGTSIRYGNMETEPVEETSHIGSYPISVVPNRYRTALVCVHDIVSAGHVVTFTDHETIVSDIGSAYTLRIPRIPDSREWRVPLHLLQQLTDLRANHPLRHAQAHYGGDSHPN